MRAINRKLLRDLWHVRGQALAIIVIIASGVALFVAQLGTLESLKHARSDFYARYRFADVFANCKRAPESLAPRIREIPGVDTVETRVVLGVMLDVPELDEPATARLISIPEGRQPALNALHLKRGRLPHPDAADEIAVIEMFAAANGYREGDTIDATINGRRRTLTMVGFVLSPEHVYSLPADSVVPDDRRHAVMWMNRRALAAAYNMEGSFNDVALRLQPGASRADALARLDALLAPYGGLGAYERKEQVSDWFLENEFKQLETFGVFIPIIFLGVAAFLLNVVLSRLISTQRDQIAALKAFGYTNFDVGLHFMGMVAVFMVLGGALGSVLGWWLSGLLIDVYRTYYNFHALERILPLWIPAAGFVVTAAASAAGTLNAVRRAAALPPAEAMRPEAPPSYRATLVERLGLQRWMSQPSRMIMRQLERRPFKAALTVVGLSFAVAILVMGTAWVDIVYYVIDVQTNVVHREDVDVSFHEPRGRKAVHELQALDGVHYVEPYRTVPARVKFEHRQRRVAINGLPADARLDRVLGRDLQPIALPSEGVLLSRVLGEALGISPGDELTVEVLEGARPVRSIRVVALVDDFMGVAAYMEIGALNRLMREGDVISGAKLLADARATPALMRELGDRPAVRGVVSSRAAVDNLRRMVEESLLVMILVNVMFAFIIAFGIIYNAARVSLSERARELASLRVLGMTRGEISYILLGELAVLTLASLPLGFVLGRAITAGTLGMIDSEVMRFPLVVSNATYALASASVIVAATVSALLVRRRLDRLDLVEVLKSRE